MQRRQSTREDMHEKMSHRYFKMNNAFVCVANYRGGSLKNIDCPYNHIAENVD